ncbi:TetR family transcriptional regulator [Ruegeria lacuscaerulensis]|uniref:TetR family transcriptional regulator n=1 Tax=Ruegeria lacuscaerulensis TaxID=55218 RepID=UPI00147F22A7
MKLKSQKVHDAILKAARAEFTERGYVKATISKIAASAAISPSNVYVYFQSKLEIMLAVYEPWFKSKVKSFLAQQDVTAETENRIHALLTALWSQIPGRREGLTTPFMQALAMATPEEKYNPELLIWTENKIAEELIEILGAESLTRDQALAYAHLILITFDGVALRRNLQGLPDRSARMVQEMAALLAGIKKT